MLWANIGVWRSSTRGRKKVSSVVFRDWSKAKRRRRLSIGTSGGGRGGGQAKTQVVGSLTGRGRQE